MINLNEIKKGKLIEGDCLKELTRIPSGCIDQVITDPPYGLAYHTYKWDKQQADIAIWKEVLRILKPGAFAFVISSARQDLLSQQIHVLKKSGFVMKFRSIYWVYKTGIPKAKNIESMMSSPQDKANFKGAYASFQPKSATDVILVAMKPGTEKTYTEQAKSNGKGITFLDNCKIPFKNKKSELETKFMSNLIVSDNALDSFENECGSIECIDKEGHSLRFSLDSWAKHTLPYLVIPKVSPKERDMGLHNLSKKGLVFRRPGLKSHTSPMLPSPSPRKNIHPMVKPIKLMAYLVALGSRQGEVVLDPFCGSGTTCVSAMLLGRKFIGVEKDTNYHEIARERLLNITRVPEDKNEKKPKPPKVNRLSEVESIDLRFKDKSVIDLNALPSVIDHAFEVQEKPTEYKGFEITPTLITADNSSQKPSQYQKIASDMKKRLGAKRKAKIISVSYRTDIPAFYSDWFFNRVKEGLILRKTELDSKVKKVYLTPNDVRCFVFWTKNPGPMLDRLDELKEYYYYFHFTLTPYGRNIERNLPPKEELIETFIRFSERIGKEKLIWRYDPIILTDSIDIEYHKKHFERLVKKLHKYTDKCIISFVNQDQIEEMTRANMGLKPIDDDMKWELASWIQFIAESYGLRIETCAQKIDFSEIGIRRAKCVDPNLIEAITGEPVEIVKKISLRKDCGCAPSTDIGTNNTCIHGCRFCYATKNDVQARLSYHQHDKNSPAMTIETDGTGQKEKDNVQDWADKGINVYRGCSNDCLYCYAREISVRQHGNTPDQWKNEKLNVKILKKGWRISNKKLMFPTTHDITPGTYDACEIVLKKLLKAGNTVLIVSKPRAALIEKLCDALKPYKKQILFRFTIGTQNNERLSFWEPNAPVYEDRRDALKIAHEKGFNTSVSLEPMLDPANIESLIEDLRDFTTDSMWIGTMNMIGKRVEVNSEKVEEEISKIEAGQTPEKLMAIYDKFKNDPLIKWKGHVRKMLKKLDIEVPEQNDDWRERMKF